MENLLHPSALKTINLFNDIYCSPGLTVLDVGSADINGGIREIFNSNLFTGVDLESGEGTDVVLEDPYKYPFKQNSFDIIIATSVFEHSDFFWMLFIELTRILSEGGYLLITAPSNGYIHRHPIDSWRFYPDSASSMEKWAKLYGYKMQLLESFLTIPDYSNIEIDCWSDFVAVYQKGKFDDKINFVNPDKRIIDFTEHENGYRNPKNEFVNPIKDQKSCDQKQIKLLQNILKERNDAP